jgi:serine/threonine protein kinase
MARMLRSSRRNELAIRSFRLFESHKKIRRLRVPLRELQPVRLLSSGSTGEVWLALHGTKQVAIKQLLPAKRRVLREMEMFLAEVYLLAQLKHRNIVPLVAIAWNTLEHVVMVQEYMEGGDLMHYLATQRPAKPAAPTSNHKDSASLSSASSSHHSITIPTLTNNNTIEPFAAENRSFTWSKQRLQIAQAVASALKYMHALTPKLLHRDVKSRNVLLNAHLEAKLSDFGISRRKYQLEDDVETNNNLSVAGTMAWTAPELLLGEAYTEKVDIYSFGILLSEIDTCLLPYHDTESLAARLVQHPLRLMKKIVNEGVRPRLTADCPPKIAQLVAACVHRDSRMRPSAGEVVALLAAAMPGERGLLSRKSSSFVS